MLNIDHLVKKPRRRVIDGNVAYVLTMAALGMLGLIVGCSGAATGPNEPTVLPSAPDAETSPDAGAQPYCNTTNPQNSTKFISLLFPQDPDGTTCAAAYSISFGVRTFSCSCAVQATCEAAMAAFSEQAAACPMAGW